MYNILLEMSFGKFINNMTLEDLLIKTVEEEASDLHITVGTSPRIRKSGSFDNPIRILESKLVKNNPWRDTKSGVLSDLGPHLMDLCLYFFVHAEP